MARALRLSLFAALCALALASGPARAQEDSAEARAARLIAQERYKEALRELEAAYSVRQSPQTLYQMAVTYQRLGYAREAAERYRRFLATGSATAAQRAEVEAALQHLSGLLLAAPPPPGPGLEGQALDPGTRLVPVRTERRRNTGLMRAGISLLSIGYGGALVTGAVMAGISGASSSSRDRNFATGSGLLLIPVVGPLISSIYMPATTDSLSALYWSMPWMLSSAGLQVSGLIMTVVGAKTYRDVLVVPGTREPVHIAPYASLGGGGLMATGRF